MNLSELQEILRAIIQDGVDESNVIDRIENQLKEQDFDIIFSDMDVKTTLLHVAASMDRLRIVEYLVGKKMLLLIYKTRMIILPYTVLFARIISV